MADAAAETLTALEERLRRVELLLRGGAEGSDTNGPSEENDRPVASRLDKIEKRLAELCSHSEPIGELLQLHSRLPELSSDETVSNDDMPAASKLPIVVASSSVISNAASQLNAIRDSPMPAAAPMANLASLQSRLDQARAVQEQQMDVIEWLRHRTSSLLEKWYGESILRGGDQWVDWEQRLASSEQAVRRREAVNARARNEI